MDQPTSSRSVPPLEEAMVDVEKNDDVGDDDQSSCSRYQANSKRRERRKGAGVTNPRWLGLLNDNIKEYLAKEERTTSAWTSEELVELYKLVCKYGCCHEAVSHVFSERLAPRPLDDIRTKIVEIHGLIERTNIGHRNEEFERCTDPEANCEPPFKDTKVNTWLQAIWELLTSRQLGDESNMAMLDVLRQCNEKERVTRKRRGTTVPMTNSAAAKCRRIATLPDYSAVYNAIEMMAAMRDPSKMKIRSVDAALLLSVFDEIEREVDQRHARQMPLYASIFRDLQCEYFEEFNIIHQLNSDVDCGSAHINLFGLKEQHRNLFFDDADSDDAEEPEQTAQAVQQSASPPTQDSNGTIEAAPVVAKIEPADS